MINDENTLDDASFDLSKKKKGKKRLSRLPLTETTVSTAASNDTSPDETNDATTEDSDYTYHYLIKRAFDMIGRTREIDHDSNRRITVPVPRLARVGTRRTSVINFASMSKAIKRQEKSLYEYFTVELGTTASIDANRALIIKGRFSQLQIENVLRSFIRDYVLCKTCHSPDTSLGKAQRLTVIKCNTCNSQYSVASIRTGFQAQIGRRSNGTS